MHCPEASTTVRVLCTANILSVMHVSRQAKQVRCQGSVRQSAKRRHRIGEEVTNLAAELDLDSFASIVTACGSVTTSRIRYVRWACYY